MILLRSVPAIHGVPAPRDAAPVFVTGATVVVPTHPSRCRPALSPMA